MNLRRILDNPVTVAVRCRCKIRLDNQHDTPRVFPVIIGLHGKNRIPVPQSDRIRQRDHAFRKQVKPGPVRFRLDTAQFYRFVPVRDRRQVREFRDPGRIMQVHQTVLRIIVCSVIERNRFARCDTIARAGQCGTGIILIDELPVIGILIQEHPLLRRSIGLIFR